MSWRSALTKLKKFLILSLGAYACLLVGIGVFQRSFLYFPNHFYVSPDEARAHPSLKELSVTTEDGLQLKGWYAPATSEPLTLVYFHGNADNLKSAAPIAGPYIDAGYGYLIVEYRGYSLMPGSPTEQGLYADGRAFIRKLSEMGVSENKIVLIGHSLGTGVATQMATEFDVRGLMLLTPFLSIAKMAQVRFPFLPADQMTLDRFENWKKLPTLHMPLLVAASGRDFVVPTEQETALFDFGNEPKQLYLSHESGHNNLYENGFLPVSLDWLQRIAPNDP